MGTRERLIARFGSGRLVRCGDVRYELRGGDDMDMACAREWAAHFLHEAFIERPLIPHDRTQGLRAREVQTPLRFVRSLWS